MVYGMSPNRWMDQELFPDWFFKHFLIHAVSETPLLFLLDGHSSHYTLDLVKAAAEKDVIICYHHILLQIANHLTQVVLVH